MYTPQSVVWRLTPTHPGIRAAGSSHWTGGVDTIQYIAALQLRYVYLPFPFSGNPVSSQYLDTLLSYWLSLSLVPLSCPIKLHGAGEKSGPTGNVRGLRYKATMVLALTSW